MTGLPPEGSALSGPTGTILTGVLKWNGEPVTLCDKQCDSGNFRHQARCARIHGHPEDQYGCICTHCVEGLWP